MCTAKPIRLCWCEAWSESSLGTQVILQVLVCSGSHFKMKQQRSGSIMFVQFSLSEYLSQLMTKPTKWYVRPAKTQLSLTIRPVWSETSPSAWRKLGSLATECTAKTRIRLGGCPGWSESSLGTQAILLVLSWGGSFRRIAVPVVSQTCRYTGNTVDQTSQTTRPPYSTSASGWNDHLGKKRDFERV